MKKLTALLGVIALMSTAVACGGDACDDLADKFEDCGADTSNVKTDDCSDAELTCAECLVDCLDDSCSNMMDCAANTCLSDCSG